MFMSYRGDGGCKLNVLKRRESVESPFEMASRTSMAIEVISYELIYDVR